MQPDNDEQQQQAGGVEASAGEDTAASDDQRSDVELGVLGTSDIAAQDEAQLDASAPTQDEQPLEEAGFDSVGDAVADQGEDAGSTESISAEVEEPAAETAPVEEPAAETAPVEEPAAETAPVEEPAAETAPV